MFDYLISNLEEIIKESFLDETVDESSWEYRKYRERKTDIVTNIMNKLGISCSRQIILCMNSDRLQPRSCIYFYKLHQRYENFTKG